MAYGLFIHVLYRIFQKKYSLVSIIIFNQSQNLLFHIGMGYIGEKILNVDEIRELNALFDMP